MSEMSDWSDEETGETLYGTVACSAPCPENDGECAPEAATTPVAPAARTRRSTAG
jgi:hypothetical protein